MVLFFTYISTDHILTKRLGGLDMDYTRRAISSDERDARTYLYQFEVYLKPMSIVNFFCSVIGVGRNQPLALHRIDTRGGKKNHPKDTQPRRHH